MLAVSSWDKKMDWNRSEYINVVFNTSKSKVNLNNTQTFGLCLKQGMECTYKMLIYLMTLRKIIVVYFVNTAKLMNILPDKYF